MSSSKLLSLFISFCLLFEQSLFAQAIDLSRYFARNSGKAVIQSDKFRPLHLRYLGYDNLSQDFKILLDKGDAKKEDLENKAYIEENTQTLLKYFFIGLSLPNDKFWVNLRPDSPDNILDPDLEKTDIGRIFLEADLQLKKDTASFTSPQTPQGKAYWDKLYKKAGELFGSENITIPTITRPWIVPGEIIIREAPDNAYIYKATLKVMLEEDYMTSRGGSRTAPTPDQYTFSDPRLKELNQYSTQLIKETIIPKLTYEVNTSKRYAPLRQVYYSLILAQWFKQKYGSVRSTSAPVTRAPVNSYVDLIDSGNLTNLTSKEPYDKQVYFQQYQKSFKDGEYNLQEPVYTPMGQSIRRYTSGGVIVDITSSSITVIKANKGDIPFSSSPMNFYVSPGNQDKFNLTVPMMSFPGRLSPTDELIYSLLQEKRKISQEKLRIVDLGVGYLPYTTLELANKVKDLGAEVLGVDRVYPYKVIRKPGHYVVVFEESEDKKPRFVNAYSENAAFVPPGKDEAEAMLARIDREKETGIKEEFYVRPFEDFQKKAPNLRFKKGDFDNDPGGLQLENVDVIRVCNVLSYYWDSYKEIIENRLAPLLKPDGLLIVGEQDIESGELRVELWRKRQGSIVLEEEMNLVGIGRRLVGPKAEPEQILVGKKVGPLGTNLENFIHKELGLTDMGEVKRIDESELKKFREIIVNRLNRLDIHAEIRPGGFISVKRASSAVNGGQRQPPDSQAPGSINMDEVLRLSNELQRLIDSYSDIQHKQILEIFLEMLQKSPPDFERIMSRVTKRPIKIKDLNGKVNIGYHARGSNKIVYKVMFYTRKEKLNILVAVKKEGGRGRIQQNEIADLNWLSTSKRKSLGLVPIFGVSSKIKDGRIMYIEEFIEGETVKGYKEKKGLDDWLKKKIVTTLFSVGILLGNVFPKDVHDDNFIITAKNEVVMVDIGNKRFSLGEAVRNENYNSMVEFLLLISLQYDQKEKDLFIIPALTESFDNIDNFLKENNISDIRPGKKISEAKEEIYNFIEATRNYLVNISDTQKGRLKKTIAKGNPYLHSYFKLHNISAQDQEVFIDRHLLRIKESLTHTDNYKKIHIASSAIYKKGGIAFNALPIQTEAVSSSALGALPGARAFKGDLDAEWAQIQAVFNAGIRPSAQRLADFAAAGAASPMASQRREDVLGLVAELLRRDEEDVRLAPIDPTLKGLLNALESLL